MSSLTPAMRQYLEIKAGYPDCILFFRMGDFYEMFFEDAVLASKLLDITLTSRDKGREDSVPLCGFPWHAASSYIAKLIAKGHKVAICEQMEDPRFAKGIVKREVVRVITPGLVVDADNLEAKENNFLAGIAVRSEGFGLDFLDISTGEFRVTEVADRNFLIDEVIRQRAARRPPATRTGTAQLSIHEARQLVPHNTATSLQVCVAVLSGMIWAIENPEAGVIEPDEMDFRRNLEICAPYLGPVVGAYTDWTPLYQRGHLFEEDLDTSDPWQFRNVLV